MQVTLGLKINECFNFKKVKKKKTIKGYNKSMKCILVSMQGTGDGYYLHASAIRDDPSRVMLFNIIAASSLWLFKFKCEVAKIRNTGP